MSHDHREDHRGIDGGATAKYCTRFSDRCDECDLGKRCSLKGLRASPGRWEGVHGT